MLLISLYFISLNRYSCKTKTKKILLQKMKNDNLLHEAIVDAKNLRAAAITNAKKSLEEHFQPQIQSMFEKKIMEEDELEENLEIGDEFTNENEYSDEMGDSELDELLAELENELNETEDLDEAEDKEEKEDKKPKKDKEDKPKADSKPKAEKEEGEEDEEEVKDLTMDDLKDIIKDVVSELMGDEKGEEDLENLGGEENLGDDMGMDTPGNGGFGGDDLGGEDINIDELLAEIDEDKLNETEDLDESAADLEEVKQELNEAHKVIRVLKKQINEVHLLNTKLFYTNKLFKSNLNESTKHKIIDAFDKATTIKEVENIYNVLKESIKLNVSNKKTNLKESLGFASKPINMIKPKKDVVEVDPTIARFQKLAGITK